MTFIKGLIPWNKGLREVMPEPWNKGKKGLMPTPWNKGLNYKTEPCPDKVKIKISDSQKGKPRPYTSGDKNGNWKGEKASYGSIHDWVSRHLGNPDTCEHCGKSGLTGCKIQWANIDHFYRRDFNDWIRLCVPCHRKYDKSRGEKIN